MSHTEYFGYDWHVSVSVFWLCA